MECWKYLLHQPLLPLHLFYRNSSVAFVGFFDFWYIVSLKHINIECFDAFLSICEHFEETMFQKFKNSIISVICHHGDRCFLNSQKKKLYDPFVWKIYAVALNYWLLVYTHSKQKHSRKPYSLNKMNRFTNAKKKSSCSTFILGNL